MNFYCGKLYSFTKGYKYSISIYILLFVLSLMFGATIKGLHLKIIAFASINAVLLFLIHFILSNILPRFLTASILSIFMAFEVGFFYVYRNPMNYGIVASIFETNFMEAYDMIKIGLPAGLLILVLFFVLLYKSSFEIKGRGFKSVLFSILVLIIGIFVLPPLLYKKSRSVSFEVIGQDLLVQPATFYYSILSTKYPFVIGDAFIVASYLESIARAKIELLKPKGLPAGIVYEKSRDIDKIILVIGESSVCHNFSLYGYSLKTTPFLDSLSVNDSVFAYYSNVISPAPYTLEALRIGLSFATPLDSKPFFDKKNIFHLAEDIGYETAWISSLPKFGLSNSIINQIASNVNISIFQDNSSVDDLDLIPKVSSILTSGKKQFVALHLIGSHLDYKGRFDAEDTRALGTSGKTIDYDKTIHHTDRVLASLYNLIKDLDENVLIYYFSDHGEVINKGHGFPNKYKVQYQIPLIVMQNKPTIRIDDVVQKYYNGEINRLNASSNIYILSEFLGYKVADSLVIKSRKDGEYVFQPNGTSVHYENIID